MLPDLSWPLSWSTLTTSLQVSHPCTVPRALLYLCACVTDLWKPLWWLRGQVSLSVTADRDQRWWHNILMHPSRSISRCHPVLGEQHPPTFFFFWAPGLLGPHSRLPVSLPSVTQGLWIDAGVCSVQSAGHWHVWLMSARPRRKAPNWRHYTDSTSELP